ncbi:hypothetical protein [Acinetobacter nematophilus]|uniref:Uncharacterized protein n=1 Tax=Acinetobacter nematophilus TaxID=2994642 RepID=A0A9X3DS88_9GAMM|nr:hypothetical protein [Acinetobacter nematophilus]MCX5467148.1 hypothetical protein [Acinetobacter nematophilus]
MFEDSENVLRSAHDANGVTILIRNMKEPNPNILEIAGYYFESMDDFQNMLKKST